MTLRYLLFLTVALLVLFGFCSISFGYFSIVFNLSTSQTLAYTLALFLVSSFYIVGDKVGQKTSIFLFKWIGGIGMGAASIGVSIGLIGYLGLFLKLESKLIGLGRVVVWMLGDLLENLTAFIIIKVF